MASIGFATAIAAMRPVIQGALGAATAQLGLRLCATNTKTPEQKLTEWAWTLIAGCAFGTALGVSAAALLVGSAVHVLMLLKEREELFKKIPTEEGPQKILFDNFPCPLPMATQDNPIDFAPGELFVNQVVLCETRPRFSYKPLPSPCLSTHVEYNGAKTLVNFNLNTDGTLSTAEEPWHKFPVTIDEEVGRASVEIPNEIAKQLFIERSCASPLKTTVITPGTYNPPLALYGDKVYFLVENYNRYEYKQVTAEPESPISKHALNTIGQENSGFCYVKLNGNLFTIAFCKISDGLYLKDQWGSWQKVGERNLSDLSAIASDLPRRLGLSTSLLLKKLRTPQPGNSEEERTITQGTISTDPRVWLANGEYASLRAVSETASLIYEASLSNELFNNSREEIYVRMETNPQNRQLALNPEDYRRLCELRDA